MKNQLEKTLCQENYIKNNLDEGYNKDISSSEKQYLESMMSTLRQDGYNCITCNECSSCGASP